MTEFERILVPLDGPSLADAESYRQVRQGELRQQGFDVRISVGGTSPAENITEATTAKNADLFVASSHGRGGLARWAFGSVADKVSGHSPCPVLLVREKLESRLQGANPNDSFLCTDSPAIYRYDLATKTWSVKHSLGRLSPLLNTLLTEKGMILISLRQTALSWLGPAGLRIRP